VENRLFPPRRAPGAGRPRDREIEDQIRLLDGVRAFGVAVAPDGRRPLTAAEARFLTVGVELREVYLESCSIPLNPWLDERVRQRARTLEQRERRIRRRRRREQCSVTPHGLNRVRDLVRAALKDPDR
jgi:hypothetical protein